MCLVNKHLECFGPSKNQYNFSFSAGFVATQMGFPIELVTAVNPNDIVHRTFKSGDWRMLPDVKSTWASAMDIQVNFKSLIE